MPAEMITRIISMMFKLTFEAANIAIVKRRRYSNDLSSWKLGERNSMTLSTINLFEVALIGYSRICQPKGLTRDAKRHRSMTRARFFVFFLYLSFSAPAEDIEKRIFPKRYTPVSTKPMINAPCRLTQKSMITGRKYRRFLSSY